MPALRSISFIVVALVSAPADAGAFLGAKDVSREDVESSLLSELAGAVRPSSSRDSDRLVQLENALRPMYQAVPQETDGTLGHAVVRYVLHRFFVQRYGWFIRGLEPAGDKQDISSANLQDMQEWVPSYLQGFLEQMMEGRGISLRELAVFAATLEDLIFKEDVNRLEIAYGKLFLPVDSKLNESNVQRVLETYLVIYMEDSNFTVASGSEMDEVLRSFREEEKGWSKAVQWTQEVRKSLIASEGLVDFESMTRVVQEIGRRFGSFNDLECQSLKSDMLNAESRKPGRLRLSEFYKKGLKGHFAMTEKIEYLRVLGALDESNSTHPHVIVPNYMASRPNCLASSSIYAVCCRNECEDLMGALEGTINGPAAEPEQIAKLVSSLPSGTVEAPRTLSVELLGRLQSIAVGHGGKVPLHGRLFAQWMHHAFPRECPYPHEASSASPQTPDEWMKENGKEQTQASEEEMIRHVESDVCAVDSPEACATDKDLPWHGEEVLLAKPVAVTKDEPKRKRSYLKSLAMITILWSMAYGLVCAFRSVHSSSQRGEEKHYAHMA